MKQRIQERLSFIARSMLWSLLLYVLFMLAFNWDDVRNTVTGKDPITIVTNDRQNPAANNPAYPKRVTVVKGIITIMKTITGIAHASVVY